MLDFFQSIDESIFFFINHTLSNPLFDKFFPFITDVHNWYLVYVLLLGTVLVKGGRIGRIAVIMSLFMIAFSDQFSSNLLKNTFERIRPCNALENVNILAGCTGSYSFPSSHAVNNFAVAMFFYAFYPNLKKILFITAAIIAISRPYVGVHYPFDIVMGALIGTGIGYIFSVLAMKLNEQINRKFPSKEMVSE
ncbi:MAG: phosphatase PAP2 family protein [Melioribacteraceae bacterium]|nr:phosphatase PAP2 family protein [Melioribacteraceae bacterium]MCF8263591.1 phosphatase PAP2 family protein [Melioribacteraceae bacterium]MCF8412416.1 phosphatase PAP2 family protein [Melioribacteraceae bacterium]MCF8432188.1 phosphatase PAP2 family protein [Melioribacteraceae bacterium]